MPTTKSRDHRRLCEWALLTGDRLPEEYGPCDPENERGEAGASR